MKARLALLGVGLASVVTACSGSTGGSNTSSFISAVPSSVTSTATFSTTATTPVSFGAISNGITASLTLPEANATATASLVYSASLPSGATAPQADAVRRMDAGASSISVLGVVSLSVPVSISVAQTPAFSFDFGSAPSSSVYIVYEDQSNPGAGWAPLLGPGVASGTKITFAAQSIVPPITFTAKDTYLFALVESTSGATPAPAQYSGTKTVNYTYGFDFGYPTPQPGATAPPTTLSYNVTDSVTLGSSPLPSGSPSASLIDEHITESDASNLATTTYSTDEWASIGSANGSEVVSVYGTQAQEPSSSSLPNYTTLYTAPQIVDEYPDTNGASWTNNPASTESYSFADGDNGVRTTAANGTYLDTEQIFGQYGGQPAIITENSDASGSITGPYFGGGLIQSLTFSAPASDSVTFTENFTAFAQTNYGLPASETLADPVWWSTPPTNSPPAFYTETDAVTTGTAIPQACGTTFGSTGNELTRTVTTFDTVVGFEDTTVMNSYDVGGVPVCLNTVDTLNYAYDTQGNTPYLIDLGSLGLEIVTTTETLTLSNGASTGLTGTPVVAAAKRAASTNFATYSPMLAALEHHEMISLASARTATLHAIVRGIRTRTAANVKLQGGSR